jgi:hypothetical protein
MNHQLLLLPQPPPHCCRACQTPHAAFLPLLLLVLQQRLLQLMNRQPKSCQCQHLRECCSSDPAAACPQLLLSPQPLQRQQQQQLQQLPLILMVSPEAEASWGRQTPQQRAKTPHCYF